eukprot:TRINITY_DN6192_c0_g1_i1.p2 TRINITY_DN6192_c0_g1~~TRINITY_DN6192_c0_g1_i1.p2  ORF type:complete len:598 (+),score=131.96 TRINITY_DN6192_c0_g1_i1:2208-4001(+)
MQYLDLSSNRLTGIIPAVGSFQNLTHFNISSNQFYGYVPLTISYLIEKSNATVDLQNNSFVCPLPSWTSDIATCNNKIWMYAFYGVFLICLVVLSISILLDYVYWRKYGKTINIRRVFLHRKRFSMSLTIMCVIETTAATLIAIVAAVLIVTNRTMFTPFFLNSLLYGSITLLIISLITLIGVYYFYVRSTTTTLVIRLAVLVCLAYWTYPSTFGTNDQLDPVLKIGLMALALLESIIITIGSLLLISIIGARQENAQKLRVEAAKYNDILNSLRRQPWFQRTEDLVIYGEKIGGGAYGDIYKGTWQSSTVVVKVLDRSLSSGTSEIDDFIQEVNIMWQMNHPNIAQVLGASMDKGHLMIVMDYYPRGNLREFLDTNQLNWTIRLEFALGIARGMRYIHSRNIIHRDLKSRNLLLDSDRGIRITDFGLSRFQDIKMTRAQGTIGYIAPEALSKETLTEYDFKVDVYSYAIVLWELITCDEPINDIKEQLGSKFHPASVSRMIKERNMRPILPAETPAPWSQLIEDCWASEPRQRPNFSKIVQILERFDVKGYEEPAVVTRGGFFTNDDSDDKEENNGDNDGDELTSLLRSKNEMNDY